MSEGSRQISTTNKNSTEVVAAIPLTTKQKAMLEALEKSLGVVATASKSCGLHRSSHYVWMQESPTYAEAYNDIKELVLDFAESHLHQLISKGDVASTIFFLKTRGKSRGYVERTEITGSEGAPIIHIQHNL
jgi:hypothetical protein